MATNRAAIVADYQSKWDDLTVTRTAAVDAAAKRIIANAPAYKAVEDKTGVPWFFVGALHMRECSNNMRGCLHNGELIIGTGRKTRLVPKGRGPFATWEEAAIDALAIEGFTSMPDKSPGALCEAAERFNGLGYRNKGRPSPYVWAGSQWYTSGKYVADHVYSAKAVDPQLGVAPVMKRVLELSSGEVATSFMGRLAAKNAAEKAIVNNSRRLRFGDRCGNVIELALGGIGATAALAGQVAAFVTDWRTVAILGLLVAMWAIIKWQKRQSLREVAEGRAVPSGLAAMEEPADA